jgi:hypothetical protein
MMSRSQREYLTSIEGQALNEIDDGAVGRRGEDDEDTRTRRDERADGSGERYRDTPKGLSVTMHIKNAKGRRQRTSIRAVGEVEPEL